LLDYKFTASGKFKLGKSTDKKAQQPFKFLYPTCMHLTMPLQLTPSEFWNSSVISPVIISICMVSEYNMFCVRL